MMEHTNIIKKTIDYIENNLDSQLNLDTIAKEAGYSKFHLNRMFLECVGCTIYKYIQMRRLTVAAEKLVYTKKPVIDIAYEANYSSQESFTFAFRRLYGHPPQEYRAINVYTPKFHKFELKGNLVMFYKPAVKCEVIAA
ncbi:AraC family transcriptional regulator [Faecalicatena orotica]|uniref:AraC-like DNA-binding protein n=1 Tax=Faecalicatena orotica TaxID=1544 RepID=A0A2Y9BFP7_9FIRM|nr:helix-turn-helix domain-containing protein [Faecalicatena orotica]PWJ28571.1 AraC-like DNA-binding protein [Faecalicatena orotica]SSA56392.1 AraC-type DNA-binding protein [Faecalicatena orotica]